MEITKLKFLTYSKLINNIDYTDTLKKKSTFNYINLEKLVNNFKLDFEYSPPDYIPYGSHPGFISKSYYQSTPELGYNLPPNGPIPDTFLCTYCKKVGPEFHSINCKRPFESSLVLTEEGTGSFPGRAKGTAYLLISKKPGQKKVITESIRSERFADSVEVIYESENFSKYIARIFRNGVINVISATDPDFGDKIIAKVNGAGAFTPEFPYQKITIDSDLSYMYLILAQFNIFPEKTAFHLDLRSFDTFLQEYKKTQNQKQVLIFNGTLVINNYVFNSGEIKSRNDKATNPYIKFNILFDESKVNVMIYNKGAVQLRASNKKGTRNNVEKIDILQVYSFLKDLFAAIIKESNDAGYPIILPDTTKPKKLGMDNLIDSKEPQMVQNRAGYEIRPVPFSFYGKCPLPGYYVAPRGVRRSDGKYEPQCYQIKKSGKDSKARLYDILMNGYPDANAAKYNESVPDPDTLSAVYKPGTKILESRRRPGLKDLSKESLITCIQDTGYITPKTVFTSYSGLKESVVSGYSSLVGTNSILKQMPIVLTPESFDNFTTKRFLVTPVISGTIYALLYFNSNGESFFLNLNGDVSQSSLPSIPELHDTIIEGQLLPFKHPEFIFYITDLLFYTKINVMSSEFYNQTNNDRFTGMTYCLGVMNRHPGNLQIELHYDLDIINGAKYYISNFEISGLLFVGYTSHYTANKTNKNVMIWNNFLNKTNLYISLDVRKDQTKKNRWFVSIDSKNIPQDLLPQIESTVEIPIKFTDDHQIKDGDHILFKILLNQINETISIKKPLAPLEKLDANVNDYSEVITLLQSIQSPIKQETFMHPRGFKINSKVYISVTIDRPLTIES